jgi:hypothetical protein
MALMDTSTTPTRRIINVSYFGITDDIWELDYGMGIEIALSFGAFGSNNTHQVNNYGLTIVDLC